MTFILFLIFLFNFHFYYFIYIYFYFSFLKHLDYRNNRPVPTKSIRREWGKKAIIILIDEYWTSQKCACCGNQVTQGSKYKELLQRNQPDESKENKKEVCRKENKQEILSSSSSHSEKQEDLQKFQIKLLKMKDRALQHCTNPKSESKIFLFNF